MDVIFGPTKVVAAVEELVGDKDPDFLFCAYGTGTPLVRVHHSRGQLHRKRKGSLSPRNKLKNFLLTRPRTLMIY